MKTKLTKWRLVKLFTGLFALALCTSNACFAQTPSFSAYAIFNDSLRETSNALKAQFKILDIDTNATAEFEISVGATENDSGLVFETVAFDPNSLAGGMSYERIADRVNIGVSGPLSAWTYFCSVRIKNTSGIWSSEYRFLCN